MLQARGFSFIEILLALVLVSITGAGVSRLATDIQTQQRDARLAKGAMYLANDQLSHWRLMNTDTPCSTSNSEPIRLDNLSECLITTEDSNYELVVANEQNILMADSEVYAKTLTLSVRWRTTHGQQQTLAFYFTGVRRQNGLN
ncbi:type II secretion system protein [Salinivibrio kushneri]|uniref:Type II secretion system protein n=1 Tax=Salinivibrio kushneri TaxID=1908198 RepID=A0AA47KJU9_9GAMM|nr:type II secretion system protein [Salinivibrio kushneri]WBA08173.1 type II secretion system protein [Salinivibrio kushneri]